MKTHHIRPPLLINSFLLSFFNLLKPKTMKQFRIVAALLLLLGGFSLESMAQSPTIQREVRLVNPSGTTGYVGLKAAAGTATYTLTLPAAAPTLNQILQVGTVSGTNVPTNWVSLSDAVGNTTWLLGGNTISGTSNFLGTKNGQALSIGANDMERIGIEAGGAITLRGAATLTSTLAVTGATTLASTLGVTGATTLSSTLDVTGATTLASTLGVNGLLSANSGATISGTTTLNGLSAGTISTSDVLVVGTGNVVGKVSFSSLNGGLYRARGVVAVTDANDSGNISVADLAAADVIQVTLEGTNGMGIPSFHVSRTTGSSGFFTIYFSAPFTGTYNYAVIRN